jgi:hypothetical protein
MQARLPSSPGRVRAPRGRAAPTHPSVWSPAPLCAALVAGQRGATAEVGAPMAEGVEGEATDARAEPPPGQKRRAHLRQPAVPGQRTAGRPRGRRHVGDEKVRVAWGGPAPMRCPGPHTAPPRLPFAQTPRQTRRRAAASRRGRAALLPSCGDLARAARPATRRGRAGKPRGEGPRKQRTRKGERPFTHG